MSDNIKLVIEIPKESLHLIKTFKGKFLCNGYDLIQGVQNGIPLDNNYTVSNEYVDYQDRVGADMRGEK